MTDILHLPKAELSGSELTAREETDELFGVLEQAEIKGAAKEIALHFCELGRLENLGLVKERRSYYG